MTRPQTGTPVSMATDPDDVLRPDEITSPGEASRVRSEPTGPETDLGVPRYIDGLAWLLDDSIRIPVIGKRIGIDGAIGMIPGLGDGAGFVASSVIILSAVKQGVSRATVTRMIGNVLLESLVGVIPVVGDLFDFVWKSNSKNVNLLRADLADPERTRRSSVTVLTTSVVALIALAAIAAGALLLSIWLLVRLVDAVV